MNAYHKTAGNVDLFENAPPMAEVVLEDISRKVKRVIYAEAFRPGAHWWHSDGRRGRRGLDPKRMSDYVCAATRTPRPTEINKLRADQLIWDLGHMEQKPMSMYSNTRPCMSCGEPVSDGMIHACKYPALIDPHFGITIKPRVILGQQQEVFTSVFEPQNCDNWVRINTAGRVKFSEGLMLRFAGMKVDVAVSNTGRVRVAEADHGKVMNNRGYVYARRLVPMLDFSGLSSLLVFLHEKEDGYLYGQLPLKDGVDGAALEG